MLKAARRAGEMGMCGDFTIEGFTAEDAESAKDLLELSAQQFACGGPIAIDEFTRAQCFLAFRLELQQFKRSVAAAAGKKFFIRNAHLASVERSRIISRSNTDQLQVLSAKFCVCAGPGLKAAQPIVNLR